MLLNKKSLKKLNTLKFFKKIKMVRWFSLSQKQDIGQFDFKHELKIQNISLNGWLANDVATSLPYLAQIFTKKYYVFFNTSIFFYICPHKWIKFFFMSWSCSLSSIFSIGMRTNNRICCYPCIRSFCLIILYVIESVSRVSQIYFYS